MRSAFATVASAVAYALLFAPFEWVGLSWVALVPLFLAIRSKRPLAAAGLGGLFAVVTTACIVAWLVPTLNGHFERSLGWSLAFLFLVASLAMAPYMAFALGLWARARDRVGPVAAPLVLVAAWVASEFGRTHLGIGSAWTTLGDAHFGSERLRQVASLTGVYGVSALVALGNVAIAELLVAGRNGLRGLRWSTPGLRVSALVFAALTLAVMLHGELRLREIRRAPTQAAALEILVVQGNNPADLRWKRSSTSRFLRRYARLTRDGLRGRPERPTLVVWPENSIQTTLEDPAYGHALRGLPFKDVSFLIGVPRVGEVEGHRRHHNSALLLRPNRSVEHYDKRRLLPFSETKPFGDVFSMGERGELDPGEYAAGTRPGVMRVGDSTLGVLICMEALYPDLAREVAREGATVLVNLANDGWYGGRGGARQHLAQVVFRAVETGLPLVRSTTTGISALVSPDGTIVAQIADDESDFLRAGLPAALAGRTFYVRYGDCFALACVGFCLLAVAVPLRAPIASFPWVASPGGPPQRPQIRTPECRNTILLQWLAERSRGPAGGDDELSSANALPKPMVADAEGGHAAESRPGAGWRGMFVRLTAAIDRLIPDDLIDGEGDALIRARVVLLAPIPMAIAAVPASIEYSLGGAPIAAVVMAAGVAAVCLSPVLLRWGVALVGHYELAIFATVIAVLTWVSGGLGSPPVYAYLLLPTIAVALLGGRAAAAWTFVAIGVVAGFLALEILDKAPVAMVSKDALRRGHGVLGILGVGVTLAFTLLYDGLRANAVSELQRAREQADTANRAKTAFLANASHELRTPMNGVLGMSSLLQYSDIEARHREMIEVIHGSATSLLGVVDDILDYAQLESGSLRLTDDGFDLREVAEATVSMMMPLAERKGLRLISEIDRDVPSYLLGDSSRIRQILVNLIGNAIKFTDEGHVRLSVAANSDSQRANLTIRVDDTGPGIPESERARIFDRFERLDSSSSRVHPGSGLGLSICRGLLDLIGGEISVESEWGAGSCFKIELALPLAGKPAIEAEDAGAAPSLPQSLRILVVEDNEVNQQVIRRMIEMLGCHSDLASDGRKCLAMLEAEPFDVVLMDCHMPEMDGFEATRAIRRSAEFGDIPVIGLTASVTAQDTEACYAAGMDQMLAKPCTIQVLHDALVKRCEKAKEGETR